MELGKFKFWAKDRNLLPNQPVPAFFHCTFNLLGKLAIADGEFCESEMEAVNLFIEDAFKFDALQEQRMRRVLTDGLNSQSSGVELATEFKQRFPDQEILHELLLDILLQVSVADGDYAEEEQALILAVAKALGISKKRYEQLQFRFIGSKDFSKDENTLYYNLLGCSEDASLDEVCKQFVLLKAKYDTDAFRKDGFSEALLQYMLHRFERIEQAYAIIVESHGGARLTN